MIDKISFKSANMELPKSGNLLCFVDDNMDCGNDTKALLGGTVDYIKKAAKLVNFKAKKFAALDLIAPADLDVDRLIVICTGADKLSEYDWVRMGGVAASKVNQGVVSVIVEDKYAIPEPAIAAGFAEGFGLRSYKFDKYKSDDNKEPQINVTVRLLHPQYTKLRVQLTFSQTMIDSVALTRDLINEPANNMGTLELTRIAIRELEQFGVKFKVLKRKQLKKLGMNAMLGVAQGSKSPPRLLTMEWHGNTSDTTNIALVGKGVVFDSGGMSLKPPKDMGEMKGDMAGAAAVIGVIRALAASKTRVNAVGVVGLVENMIGPDAQRPGDIVKSMSGKTIEVDNTDAEGRLVLADAICYTQKQFKPKVMVDVATLTGSIVMALGQHYTGLFSNDDETVSQMAEAGIASGEKVWRMPIGEEYAKELETTIADINNISTKSFFGSASHAAEFLHTFIDDTKWAHLDIAATCFNPKKTEINDVWSSGTGVRLLTRWLRDYHS